MIAFTLTEWIIIGLIFLLGIVVGMLMRAGAGTKWRERYKAEVAHRERIEESYENDKTHWRERDSLRAAAIRDRDTKLDRDRDGIDDRIEPGRQHRPGRDPHDVDRDGIDDRIEPGRQHPPGRDPHDVDRDGIDDRIEPGTQRPR